MVGSVDEISQSCNRERRDDKVRNRHKNGIANTQPYIRKADWSKQTFSPSFALCRTEEKVLEDEEGDAYRKRQSA